MLTGIAVNGLGAEQDNIAAMYRTVSDGVALEHRQIRDYAFGRWPEADHHVLHYHWIDSIANSKSTRGALALLAKLMVYITTVRARGGRVLWTVHNVSAHECLHPRIERIAYRFMAGSAAVLHFPNEAVLDGFERVYGCRLASKGRVLPEPDPTAIFGHVDRQEARSHLGFGEDEVVFIVLGVQREYKGTDLLAEAFEHLDEPLARLVIGGAVRDPEMWEAVRSRLGSDERVTLLPLHLPSSEMAALFAAAEWIVLPYRSGHNSGILTAAFARGVPAIVSRLPALTGPASEDPEAIIVTPPGDVDALRTALQTAVRMDRADWKQRSHAASRISQLENANLTARYLALYEMAAG